MAFSIQTNVNSLIAQENLRVNSNFQSQTIQRLTSGYRINQSGDDAAGLAVANKFRSDVAELTQGVRNANDGISQLQIVDGGMGNVSKMLDRLKTLATQSASGTFTGDRTVLSDEFNTLLAEIDRQAQAIGLNQGGQFAKTLSVFIGGGKTTSGAVDIDNGSVTVNLSGSTVDTNSLGLKGFQALGGLQDVSSNHTVAEIVNDATTGGSSTTLYFSGAGFADSNKVKVSVDLTGVSDLDSLVKAVNAGIASASQAGGAAATAFQNAGVSASVHTTDDGGKQLALTSGNTAFQVEAGDRLANALLGSFSAGSTGAALGTTVTASAAFDTSQVNTFGAAAAGNGTITFRFTGAGLTTPKDINLTVTSTTKIADAVTSLKTKVLADADLQTAGITLDTASIAAGTLKFNNARGEQFNVAVTGDVKNTLGFGSFVFGNSGQFDYTSIAGSSLSSDSAGSSKLEFSINGGASSGNSITVDLTLGDAQAAQVSGVTVATGGTVAIDKNSDNLAIVADGNYHAVSLTDNPAATLNDIANTITAALGADGSASVVDNQLIITSTQKGHGGSIQILAASGNTVLGLTPDNVPTYGTNRTGADIAGYLNQKFSEDAELQAASLKADFSGGKLSITSGNNTEFRVNASAVTASAAAVVVGTKAYAAATAGTFTGAQKGPTFSITATTNDQFTVSIGAGADQDCMLLEGTWTGQELASQINGQLTGAQVSWDDTAGKFTITGDTTGSAAADTVHVRAGNANGTLGFTNTQNYAGTDASAAFAVTNGVNDKLYIEVDGNLQTVTLSTGTHTIANVITDITRDATGVTATNENGYLKITSNTTGESSSVKILAGQNSAAGALGFTVGETLGGTTSSIGFGVLGVAAFGGNTQASTGTSYTVNSGGASSATVKFTALDYGSDDQVITLTAGDSSGALHPLSVTLRNDDQGRSGRSIDEAIHAINVALQGSNDSTLQKIVAVKDNTNGGQINFVSSLASFKVSLGSTTNSDGLKDATSGYTTVSSTKLSGGASVDISTQSNASAAVTALAAAVGTLGQAQAAIGKAQNQLGYALNLAQSQISNFSAAESRIRDADIASEAANLTKAQVLQQASMAAMAQANSAPQAVLALLRG